ncbi:MAG TPA: imidazole glycerol phosphate synthase subunit HisH [Desulfatiglandales bacterium]|nr:imidazole glycerol phosphate synthase subunit HisH [Desulfatiglandales bacterium]
MIAIIDYKAGNLTSVKRALDFLGQDSVITSDYSEVIKAERIIFPGVGAAGKAMADLKRHRLDQAIREAFENKRPILGICLGTQIIMEISRENNTRCLGLIKGEVHRFPDPLADSNGKRLKVPHMGWNSVRLRRRHPIFEGVTPDSEFYFVHSYYPVPGLSEIILGETYYGDWFASVLLSKNLAAVQFHLEKSGRPGLKILSNFCKWGGEDVE